MDLATAPETWMAYALELADEAGRRGEVPVGAILVLDDEIIGRGYNQTITMKDPTAHAEIVALRDAARHLDNYRLTGASMFSTIEPCTMCAGAMVHARVARLYFGADEPRSGAVGSTIDVLANEALNHRVLVHRGVCEADASRRMKDFFQSRRR